MSVIVGNALDDLVGAIVARKSDEGFMSAVDRQFLEMELEMIKNRIGAYQQGQNEHGAVTDGLKQQLSTELSNQKEIFTYLNGELAKKTDEIVDLQTRLLALQEENDRHMRETERQLEAAKDAADERTALLQNEIGVLKEELHALAAFKKNKEEIEAEMLLKGRLLEEEQAAHATSVSDLERKHVQEKDRLKKEMLIKLRETKANLLKMTDNQLDTTTKRTIAENEQMASELAWQSKEAEKLIRRNDKLAGDNGNFKRELELARQTETEMAKKVTVYQKTLDTLMAKLQANEASKEAQFKATRLHEEDGERKRTDTIRHTEVLMAKLADAEDRAIGAEHGLKRATAALNDVEARHAAVLALQDDAVRFSLQCFEDVKQQQRRTRAANLPTGSARPSSADGAPSAAPETSAHSLSNINPDEREEVLAYLLDQLRAYQQQLQELALHSAWEQHTSAATAQQHGLSLPPIAGASRTASMKGPSPEHQHAAHPFANASSRIYGVRGGGSGGGPVF